MDRELLLLGLLRRRDMHGYQLHELINQNMSLFTDLKKPTAYYLLEKMEAAGWVTPTEEQAGHRPLRRVYQLTEVGEAEFQRLLRENLAAFYPARFIGDIGLTFMDALDMDEARVLLTRRRDGLADELAKVQAAPPHSGSMQLVIDHLIHHLQSELDWLDHLMARLQPHEEGK